MLWRQIHSNTKFGQKSHGKYQGKYAGAHLTYIAAKTCSLDCLKFLHENVSMEQMDIYNSGRKWKYLGALSNSIVLPAFVYGLEFRSAHIQADRSISILQ